MVQPPKAQRCKGRHARLNDCNIKRLKDTLQIIYVPLCLGALVAKKRIKVTTLLNI